MLNALVLRKSDVWLSLVGYRVGGLGKVKAFEHWTKDGDGCHLSSGVLLKCYWMWIVLSI